MRLPGHAEDCNVYIQLYIVFVGSLQTAYERQAQCGWWLLWVLKIKSTYFLKTYSLLPISALVIFKKRTSSQINYN